MTQSKKKLSSRQIIFIAVIIILPITVLSINFVAAKYDVENKKKYDELIAKQQALRFTEHDRINQPTASQTQSTNTNQAASAVVSP
ncbi:hypothetical protein [Acinetobacter larvae]|uniref:Uncharacterized protein n=1 Tax=Acinetobacter larvae TaxID=1789224 RepID=A0A1B2M0U9_9GAMM|nr:hypothetical protein [Acinetobacter larvae]AOA58643.1 hypothetical protein BFG52_09955 [Acinetobacter larvae]